MELIELTYREPAGDVSKLLSAMPVGEPRSFFDLFLSYRDKGGRATSDGLLEIIDAAVRAGRIVCHNRYTWRKV